MSERPPIECTWDSAASVFRPTSPYQGRVASKHYGAGEVVRLMELPERSNASHNHLFAAIENTFQSLPPLLAERWPTVTHFRKYVTIKAGHCFSDSITCPSHADALRVAAWARKLDEFALVDVTGKVVTRFSAKSLSYRAIGDKKEFQRIKDKILEVLADQIGVTSGELSRAGEAA